MNKKEVQGKTKEKELTGLFKTSLDWSSYAWQKLTGFKKTKKKKKYKSNKRNIKLIKEILKKQKKFKINKRSCGHGLFLGLFTMDFLTKVTWRSKSVHENNKSFKCEICEYSFCLNGRIELIWSHFVGSKNHSNVRFMATASLKRVPWKDMLQGRVHDNKSKQEQKKVQRKI